LRKSKISKLRNTFLDISRAKPRSLPVALKTSGFSTRLLRCALTRPVRLFTTLHRNSNLCYSSDERKLCWHLYSVGSSMRFMVFRKRPKCGHYQSVQQTTVIKSLVPIPCNCVRFSTTSTCRISASAVSESGGSAAWASIAGK
jgi:hypothetical protein